MLQTCRRTLVCHQMLGMIALGHVMHDCPEVEAEVCGSDRYPVEQVGSGGGCDHHPAIMTAPCPAVLKNERPTISCL